MSDFVEPIAIVGLAGRFPGARNVEEFWDNLHDGREGLRTMSDEELLAAGVSPESVRDSRYVKVNGDAPDMDMFDAEFFGMTPREALLCDPQLRMFLECAHSALENAGHDPTAVRDVGVFAATGHSQYLSHNLGKNESVSAGSRDLQAGVFNYPDYVSTLVSYKLDLTGPSMTVLTACSSSLLTVHLAVQALQNGECDMALAGGTEVETKDQGYLWSSGGPLSRDGHCRSFDSEATGTVFSTGAGAVVLRRLSDALEDGDHIRAVIRGTAVTNDGADKVGFSAPSVSGQMAAVVEALGIARVEPESIDYVEAHGTATPLGDPIEFMALREAFRRSAAGRDLPIGYCGVGSVKSSVGHLGHAAGVASLIKVAMSLEQELLPSTLHVREPNPKLELDGSPFYLVTEPRPWPRDEGRPRRACINSLGFGGTNVHAVLEEAPPRTVLDRRPRPRLLVWSARTEDAARAYQAKLAGHLAGADQESFADTVATLQSGRTAFPVRAATVCDSADAAVAALNGGAGDVQYNVAGAPRPLAFVFPGQGAQHARMAAGLYRTDPAFTEAFDRCMDLLDAGGTLRAAWLDGDDGTLQDTGVAQPLLFAVEYALAQMWSSWGVRPAAVVGHSVGEIVAATVAGVFTLPDAARLVAARAAAMSTMPGGAMLAVRASAEQLTGILPDGVSVAVVNSPEQTVLGGTVEAIDVAAQMLAGRGLSARRVATAHAFHTPMMGPAAAEFAESFDGITTSPATVPLYSAATGALLTEEEAARPSFWTDQLTAPVVFDQALDTLLRDQDWTLLEVGPERTLGAAMRGRSDVSDGRHTVFATLPRRGAEPEADMREALTTAGSLWIRGHDLEWPALRQGEPHQRVPVPGYQYQRSRYWAVPTQPETTTPQPQKAPVMDQAEPVSPLSTLQWTERLPEKVGPYQDTTAVALLPARQEDALPLLLALQQAGLHVIPVRPGKTFEHLGVEFRVRQGESEDLARVLRTVAGNGRPVDLLVHAWAVGGWAPPTAESAPEQLDLTVLSLFDLVQQGHRAAGSGPAPDLLVLTDRSVDVSGGELLDPVKACLHGAVRTLAQEMPRQSCRLIDLASGVSEDELVRELRVRDTGVVALRRDRRWVRTERPYTPSAPERPSPFPPGGVYLITGGLGGLGLALAKGLARTGRGPRLILVGRSGEAREADLAELRSVGAEVRTFAADVADPRAMRRVLDTATAHFGPVTGVFHLAGVAGDGMMLFREPAAVREVLRPKVMGTVVLTDLFADRPPLDFFVAFASRAGVDGLVGSGDYAAANAFLDAYAQTAGIGRTKVLSIAWPAWAEVGMAAASPAGRGDLGESSQDWETTLSAADNPFLDEHRVNGVPVMPGTGLLELALTAFLDRFPQAETGAVRMREVTIASPLTVSAPRRVRVTLIPKGDGWRFELRSAPVAGGAEVLHVIGEIGADDRPAPTTDLDALRTRMAERCPPVPLSGRIFSFGPRWDHATGLAYPSGDDRMEKLVSLSLSEAFLSDLTEHRLHPALLDTALSSARDPERDEAALPFMYRSAVLYGPLPATFDSHITRRPAAEGLILADIRLIAPDGRVVAEFEGFTMRRIDRDRLMNIEDSAAGQADDSTASPARGPAAGAGIEPQAGLRILFDLLGTPVPRQVVVRPFREGAPVALAVVPASVTRPEPSAVPDPVPSAPVLSPVPSPGPRPVADRVAGPGDAVQDRLREVWAAVLGRQDIAADDDFFEVGGNSLSAIDLTDRIRSEFGRELSVAVLFDNPTFGELAAVLQEETS
ncbi:type I polyketide synthase [Actinoallomurus acanthiterrae]